MFIFVSLKASCLKSCLLFIVVLLSSQCCLPLFSQESELGSIEQVAVDTARLIPSATSASPAAFEAENTKARFSPNPTKAVLFSAIFPGLGQIYNRKYWKLPIVYGGFMGCAYAISFNNRYYQDYSNAYKDLMDGDPNTQSYRDLVPSRYVINDTTWFSGVLKRKKDFYRRYRDLSYIITVGLYALCMIDAYVDAQLFDFDISSDISLHVEPAIFVPTRYNRRGFGLQCSFSF